MNLFKFILITIISGLQALKLVCGLRHGVENTVGLRRGLRWQRHGLGPNRLNPEKYFERARRSSSQLTRWNLPVDREGKR